MRKKISLITIALLITLLVFSSTSVSAVLVDDVGFNPKSEFVYLANLDSETPVYTKNAQEKAYPASLTKIMTYIVVQEEVEDFETTKVPIKQDILDQLLGTGSSLSGLEYYVGEELSVLDLAYCMMVPSGNDASLVLADYIGNGDISAFVDLMNKKAEELGLENTHFTNPHGLHDKDQYTTAEDVYKMTKYAISLPLFMEICNTTSFEVTSAQIDDPPTISPSNQMLLENSEYYYEYTQGIKTGTTDEAGFCIATTAVKDGTAYICVTMNAPVYDSEGNWTTNGAMQDTKSLYEWAFNNLQLNQIAGEDEPITEVTLNYGQKDSVFLVPEYSSYEVLPIDMNSDDIKIVPDAQETLDAPVQKGEVIGTATIYYKDQELEKINLVAIETVNRDEFSYSMQIIQNILTSPWFLWISGIILVLFLVYLVFVFRVKKGEKKSTTRYKK